MHLVHPQTFCITFVFDFPCDDCNAQEKLGTTAVQNFFFLGGGGGGGEGVNKVHYGLCENGE